MRFQVGHLNTIRIVTFLLAICPQVTQPGYAMDAQPPKDSDRAPLSGNREELSRRARELGEIRVLVGLQTTGESDQSLDHRSDEVQAREISALQSRLLQRLSPHKVRAVTRLRLHPFMALTVDAAALDVLLSDPDVASVTEERSVRPMYYNSQVH